jgi:hypothetical protein
MGAAVGRRIALALLLCALGYGAFTLAGALGWLGRDEGPGVISGARLPAARIAERAAAQRRAAHAAGASAAKPILFGDLHVHSTLSLDAMWASLPAAGGEGARPQADACDFARHCSALDFWSLTDHAETISPRAWRDTLASLRECEARAGAGAEPDLVSFAGWEWTGAGGHRNVILRELEGAHVPARPVGATVPREEVGLLARLSLVGTRPFDSRVRDLARYLREQERAPRCAEGVASRELPADCLEDAADPGALAAKLREWGSESLAIPHGTAAGGEMPAETDFAEPLAGAPLVELYSGHGSAEEYRAWRPVLAASDGSLSCPAPSGDYTPLCWRAGEIVRARCAARGGAANQCATRAEQARRHFVAAPERLAELTVPRASEQEWRDAGQCRDCFLPAWRHRPLGSVQYLLARGLRFGFVGGSASHTARPGSGYKELARRALADFQRDGAERAPRSVPRDLPPGRSTPPEELRPPGPVGSDSSRDDERRAAYFFTGGLVAVHAAERSRAAIWDALERREVYATSGPRILLWFELLNGPAGALPMGSALALGEVPRFRVRAVGSFVQQPGCPAEAGGPDPARLAALCRGECHHPSEEPRRITRIEVVRIRPQPSPSDPVDEAIEDPWHTFGCPGGVEGCTVEFADPEFLADARTSVYYVRAIEEPSPAVNAKLLGCTRDEAGACAQVDTKPAGPGDDRLAEIEERAWSSPIFLDFDPGSGAPLLDAEGTDPLEPGFAD